MKFVNQHGKETKTTMSDDIMNQLSNMVEAELIRSKIYYLREGTNFKVRNSDLNSLLYAQFEASAKLLKDGVITVEMLENDVKSNFLEQ